jgi:hypothetical protein
MSVIRVRSRSIVASLAAEEVALAKAAVTNEARAKHYAMAAEVVE